MFKTSIQADWLIVHVIVKRKQAKKKNKVVIEKAKQKKKKKEEKEKEIKTKQNRKAKTATEQHNLLYNWQQQKKECKFGYKLQVNPT